MLWQIHQQFKDGHTEFYGQNEFNENVPSYLNKFHEWIKDITKINPLVEDAQWLMLNENDKRFLVQKKEALNDSK